MTNCQQLAAVDTEKALLGAMIRWPDESIPKVRAEIVADDFFRQSHRALYGSLLDMYQQHLPIDITTVVPFLQKAGTLEKNRRPHCCFGRAPQAHGQEHGGQLHSHGEGQGQAEECH